MYLAVSEFDGPPCQDVRTPTLGLGLTGTSGWPSSLRPLQYTGVGGVGRKHHGNAKREHPHTERLAERKARTDHMVSIRGVGCSPCVVQYIQTKLRTSSSFTTLIVPNEHFATSHEPYLGEKGRPYWTHFLTF